MVANKDDARNLLSSLTVSFKVKFENTKGVISSEGVRMAKKDRDKKT
jgi:hypothetical protein